MKNFFTVKRMCRAGIIAALYVALCYAFMPVAYQGIFQIRRSAVYSAALLPRSGSRAVCGLYAEQSCVALSRLRRVRRIACNACRRARHVHGRQIYPRKPQKPVRAR